jgi:hypothetical protein
VQEVAFCAAGALCLQGLSLVRRNGEYHHFDVLSTVGVVTDAGGTVLSSDLFDAFGVLRHAHGQAATPWRWQGRKVAEEGLLAACGGAHQLPDRALPLQKRREKPNDSMTYQGCMMLCNALGRIPCIFLAGLLRSLCNAARKHGCAAACRSIRDWQPWPDCTTPCSKVQASRCVDCCATLCQGQAARRQCDNMCSRREVMQVAQVQEVA